MQMRSVKIQVKILNIAKLHFRCLVKNPDHRPVMMEIGEHPFIQELPEDTITVPTQFPTILLNIHQFLLNQIPFRQILAEIRFGSPDQEIHSDSVHREATGSHHPQRLHEGGPRFVGHVFIQFHHL
jgi:hypothetical protein